MNWAAFLQGTAGKESSMRLAMFLVIVCILLPRAYVTFKMGVTPALTMDEVVIVLGALGMKAYQRGKETNSKELNGKEDKKE